MTASPWANPAGGYGGSVTNLLIILVVWRFATRLTRRLSFEGSRGKTAEPRLYGTERVKLEAWQRGHGKETPPKTSGTSVEETPRASHSDDNPMVPVARLAAAGILAFALGEPFLLSGPPIVGERALGAMIVFLLATGVVLAAGSGLGTLRRVRSLRGQASLGTIPGRIAAAGLVMVLLLAVALALPGFEYQGTGVLRPAAPASGVDSEDSSTFADQDTDGEPAQDNAEQERGSSGDQQRQERQQDTERSSEQARGFSKAASSLVGQLAELGKWLRWALILLAALLALWGLWQFLSHLNLGSARHWLSSVLGQLFRGLQAGLAWLWRSPDKPREVRRIDPFANWRALGMLEPREAVVAAYGRLLATFEVLEPSARRHMSFWPRCPFGSSASPSRPRISPSSTSRSPTAAPSPATRTATRPWRHWKRSKREPRLRTMPADRRSRSRASLRRYGGAHRRLERAGAPAERRQHNRPDRLRP